MAKEGKDKPEKKKRPRQERLPGTEDAAIVELETLAEEYADLRDERMAILAKEVKKKEELMGAMYRHKRTTYTHENIEIELVSTVEKVKVRIKKEKDGEGEEVDMT